MNNIDAIIIDDEERARDTLFSLLDMYCPGINIVAKCPSVPEGVIAINNLRPKLVFLDIEMPEYNGFELLNFFRDIDFEIIFVTAYNDFALKAFEVSAVDYILKPVDIDKLKNAVEKAEKRIFSGLQNNKFDVLKETYKTQQFNKIALPVSEGLFFVDIMDIVYLEADGSYTEVWMKDGNKYTVSKKIKFFEDVLVYRPTFFRSHRSYIVNINFIKKYSKSDNALILDNGKVIVISRDRKSEFEKQLKDNNITVGS